jgi:hypothetical protein
MLSAEQLASVPDLTDEQVELENFIQLEKSRADVRAHRERIDYLEQER